MEIDIFDEIEKASENQKPIVEVTAVKASEFSEDAIYIPLSYQVYTTDNGLAEGKKEIIDTYPCDRIKGIVPTGKAKKKAELMKQAFKTKTFFVLAEYEVVDGGKTQRTKEVIYTK